MLKMMTLLKKSVIFFIFILLSNVSCVVPNCRTDFSPFLGASYEKIYFYRKKSSFSLLKQTKVYSTGTTQFALSNKTK